MWKGALLLLAACGSSAPVDPVAHARAAIAAICGNELSGDSCPRMVMHGAWGGKGELKLDAQGAIAVIDLNLAGPAGMVDDLRRRARDAVEPALDGDQRHTLRVAIERLFFADDATAYDAEATFVGDARIAAYTEVDPEHPWERRVIVQIARTRRMRGPAEDVSPASSGTSPYATLDDATIAAWRSLCDDDATLTPILRFTPHAPARDPESTVPHARWNLGDVWLRCYVQQQVGSLAIIDAVWTPDTRKLVYYRAIVDHIPGGDDALVALVERTVAPLLTPEQHDRALAAARGSVNDGKFASIHVGESHEIMIRR